MSEQVFHSILTEYGKSVARDVYNGGQSVQLAQMAVGFGTVDTGNGGYIPTPEQGDLLNEWYRFELNSLTVDPENPAWLIAEGIIREDVGGHWISEISVIDTTGGVIAIATWPPSYKSTLPEGSSSAAIIRVVIEVSDTGAFELVIDTSLALITRDEFILKINELKDWVGQYFRKSAIQDEIDTDQNARLAALEVNNGQIFGVRWAKNITPTALTRLHAASGLNFTPAVNGVGGSSDFDDQPIYRDIRLCNVVNGVVTAYQGDPGFSRTPTIGDVMVEIPKFYYKIVDNGDIRDYFISDKLPDETWLVSPRHAPTPANPAGCDKIYVSAYTLNSSYRSVSGNQSVVNITRATARTNCAARGNGYWQYDYATYATIQLLYLVEVADFDSQRAVGFGNVETSWQMNTGGTDNISFHSGSTVNAGVTTGLVKYRHMENLWGNIWQFVDGINIQDRVAKISLIPEQYADDTNTDYTALSYVNASDGGYIKSLGFDPDYPFAQCPVNITGADGTFVSDYYWEASGWRVLLVGGTWDYVASAGLFAFTGSIVSTSPHTSISCRLLFVP